MSDRRDGSFVLTTFPQAQDVTFFLQIVSQHWPKTLVIHGQQQKCRAKRVILVCDASVKFHSNVNPDKAMALSRTLRQYNFSSIPHSISVGKDANETYLIHLIEEAVKLAKNKTLVVLL